MSDTKLDDETERAIETFKNAAHNCGIGNAKGTQPQFQDACMDAESALRDRVRELIEQARNEGFGKGSLMTGRGMLGLNLDGSHD